MPTVGLEIEIAGLSRTALRGIDFIQYEVHDDGSIRGDTYTVDGLPLLFTRHDHGPGYGRSGGALIIPSGCSDCRDTRIGLEIVTAPYQHEEIIPLVRRLGKLLSHIPQTAFTSIHIHVDVGNKPWRYVQSVLRWFYWLEAVLYRLSAGGVGLHRGERVSGGEFTDYRYCRPLSDSIGISWDGRRIAHLVTLDSLLNAQSASQMAAAWGRLDLYWGRGDDSQTLGHYVPHRLQGINLASVLRLGTLELRIFDGVYSAMSRFVEIAVALFRLAESETELGGSRRASLSRPLILGGIYADITSDVISELLGVCVDDLWGKTWPAAPRIHARPSHYQAMSVPSLSSSPLRSIVNNMGVRDTGDNDFVLYVRPRDRRETSV